MAEKNTVIEYGMMGSGPDGLFIVPGANPGDDDEVNIFDALIDLRDSLATGNVPPDAILKPIEDINDHVIGRLVESTVNQKKINGMEELVNVSEVSSQNRLGKIEDLDVALAISQMAALEASFQASLQMVMRVNSMQLINFI